jgi:regulator of protease activity HflC (stomatin/prohibitin superfamily)
MFLFVLSLIGLLAFIIGLLVLIFASDEDARITGAGLGFIGLLLGLIFFFISVTTSVSTRNVGVVTSFGKPDGELNPGLHMIWPWKNVTEFPATIQSDSHDGKDCISVRIANQSIACVDVTVQWRINDKEVDSLYQDYKSFEHVRDNVVTRQLQNALNIVFSTYNPLASLNSNGQSSISLPKLAQQVQADLTTAVDNRVHILTVLIPLIHHDDATQAKLQQYQAAIADTRIAQQKELTALAQAKANEELKQSVTNDPNVLVAQCLNFMEDALKANYPLPAGFSCWGSVNSVVVPAK